MKVDFALNRSSNKKNYFLVINDTYYLRISQKNFFDLAEYLKINVGD